ncbi:KleE stable inheritance protein [Carnimonas bestiolae]|uniref:KleE stable inheritance protein n=1 Tax=Carnimonas bestiolae TaxID=3402172 RepID=UPI003F4AD1C7
MRQQHCWSSIKRFMALGVVWHAFKTLYSWDTPRRHEGWVLFGWFLTLTALAYFVGCYKPEGVD